MSEETTLFINFFNSSEGGPAGSKHSHQCKTDKNGEGHTTGVIPTMGNTIKTHVHEITEGKIKKTAIGNIKDHAHAVPVPDKQ